MKRSVSILCVCVGLLAAVSPALGVATVFVTRQSGYYSGVGGEFTVLPSGVPGLADGVAVQTFCVEYNEYIWLNRTYNAAVSISAIQGGVGPEGDALDPRSAFLYDAFVDGDLAAYGYDYTPGPGRSASAGAIQDVIWYLEDERSKTWSEGSLQDRLYQAAIGSGWTDIRNVRVLNLYEGSRLRQDQIVRIMTPAPGAVILVVIGAAVVGGLKLRRLI